MKVSEYRDLISECVQWQVSLLSAVGEREQANESDRLLRAVLRLRAAECPRAGQKDRARANRTINICLRLINDPTWRY